jgi:hypothetical protein
MMTHPQAEGFRDHKRDRHAQQMPPAEEARCTLNIEGICRIFDGVVVGLEISGSVGSGAAFSF